MPRFIRNLIAILILVLAKSAYSVETYPITFDLRDRTSSFDISLGHTATSYSNLISILTSKYPSYSTATKQLLYISKDNAGVISTGYYLNPKPKQPTGYTLTNDAGPLFPDAQSACLSSLGTDNYDSYKYFDENSRFECYCKSRPGGVCDSGNYACPLEKWYRFF